MGDAVACSADALSSNQHDVTFALVFLRPFGDDVLALAGFTGCDERLLEAHASPLQADERWKVGEVLASGQPRVVALDPTQPWPGGAWRDQGSTQAMVLPLAATAEHGHEGVLVVGLNPYRLPTGDYADFLVLVAQQVAVALASADSYEAQRRRAEQLAELDRAKTEFFSNVSHEFRTPLTLMLGPLGDLLADGALPDPLREPIGMVHRNAMRLSKLVNALLEFSRIEAGRHQSSFQPTDLAHLTSELASNFRSAMDRAGLSFDVQCAPLPEPVYVDRDQWERIVLNLLSNALKFTFSGCVSVTVGAEGNEAVLRVADTGVGVPEHEVTRLFERFHRVQSIQGRTHEGSGIGLALVQELTRLHGGRVEVESRVSEGTTFTVRLPFGSSHLAVEQVRDADPHDVQARQAGAFVQEALRWLPGADAANEAANATDFGAFIGERYRATWGARVLVADDNADLRQYLVNLLQPYYQVEAVVDGQAALEAIRRRRPALLLSDVMMPRLDGFELLEALRVDPHHCTLPVILLSARAGEESRLEGLHSGADDYLVKPFTARELLARVAALIELDRVRRSGEEHLRLSLANAQMFTWDVDLATGKVAMSENAADVLGLPPLNLDAGFAALHPDDLDRHKALFEDAVRAHGQFTDEARILHAQSGEQRWLQIRGRVVCDEDGNAIRMSGLSFDISVRKAMELALRDSDQRKDEFLAMLAHELRNPMAPIRNCVELLMRLDVEPKARRAVEIIDRQTRQLTRMVDDLMDVSRITRGRIELERRPVDLATVIAAAIEAVEPAIRERRHAVDVRSGMPLTVIGDAARLQQCVVNLLTNSAKYTEPGGNIAVAIERVGDRAVISVTDDGFGIPPEIQPIVFDLFVQSERTLDRAQGGLGIGLSVVRRLVEMHGGSVEVASSGLGFGSTFRILLPVANETAIGAIGKVPAEVPSLTVLVVDDNQDAANALAMNLQINGHRVHTVIEPERAVPAALELSPHVVFLDIGMPGVDGYEVARRLRAQSALSNLHVVALTGYGQPDDTRRALEGDFDSHLVKPASWEEVAAVLREARERRADRHRA